MKITWFGHSCFRVETGSGVVLLDPFLKGNPTFETSGIDWDVTTKGVTHVALTHGHDDHMGDAEIFAGMGLINEIHRPEIGIVPIGDRFTMGARTAAMACKKYFQFKTVIPCHYGTFGLLAPNADGFVSEMKPQPVTVPKAGQVLMV